MYIISLGIISQPNVAIVLEINANTPNGAINMIISTNLRISVFACSNNSVIFFVFSPNTVRPVPVNNANTIICNILPEAIALTGFLGIMFTNTEAKLGASLGV